MQNLIIDGSAGVGKSTEIARLVKVAMAGRKRVNSRS